MHYFFEYWERPIEDIQTLWNINPENPTSSKLIDFIHFIDESVEKVQLSSDGEWTIFPKAICKKQKEKPAAQMGSELTMDDFTYALYDETKELTPENKEKMLEMAKFFKQQQDLKNK